MTTAQITALREAAKQARASAFILVEPGAKKEFSDLADKWEAEASALEFKVGSSSFHGLGAGRP